MRAVSLIPRGLYTHVAADWADIFDTPTKQEKTYLKPPCTPFLSRCTQQGETRNTQTRKYFKIIVFNDNIKGRQGKVDTPGITSRNTGNDE